MIFCKKMVNPLLIKNKIKNIYKNKIFMNFYISVIKAKRFSIFHILITQPIVVNSIFFLKIHLKNDDYIKIKKKICDF